VASGYAELLLNRFDNFARATESAWGRCADLEKVFPHGFSIEPTELDLKQNGVGDMV
jgi:hypothetical protein